MLSRYFQAVKVMGLVFSFFLSSPNFPLVSFHLCTAQYSAFLLYGYQLCRRS